MFNSKIIEILKTFSSVELKRFREFLNSPFHNKNKKAVMLFELLAKYSPAFDNPSLTKETIFIKIFGNESPHKKFNDASVRNLISDLILLSENFLSYIRFEKDSFDFNEKCLRELTARRLTGLFEKKLTKTLQLELGKKTEGETGFYNLYILEELKSYSIQFADNQKLYKDDSIEKASDYLSYFYYIRIFKMINFFRFQKMYNIESGAGFSSVALNETDLENIIKKVKDKSGKYFRIFLVYYRMYRSLSNPSDDKSYFEFKKSLKLNEEYFSAIEKYGLYVCLTNSCVQKIDSGKEEFSKECFKVYLTMTEKDLFSAYTGYFPMAAFAAILHSGIAADEFTKAVEVLKNHLQRLSPDHRENAENYLNALINFYGKNFGKALEYAVKTDTEFSQFKYFIKILTLKIYYETTDFESLYYAADSFQHFLGKNKIVSEKYRSGFNNFMRILDMLVKYRTGNDKKLFYRIEESLLNSSPAGKKWLTEKFSELDHLNY